jgi:arylsulfatase A-like enzyme
VCGSQNHPPNDDKPLSWDAAHYYKANGDDHGCLQNETIYDNVCPSNLDDDQFYDAQLADAAVAQLEGLAARTGAEAARPFFLGVGLRRPHRVWHVPRRFYELYPNNGTAPTAIPLAKHKTAPVGMPELAYIDNAWPTLKGNGSEVATRRGVRCKMARRCIGRACMRVSLCVCAVCKCAVCKHAGVAPLSTVHCPLSIVHCPLVPTAIGSQRLRCTRCLAPSDIRPHPHPRTAPRAHTHAHTHMRVHTRTHTRIHTRAHAHRRPQPIPDRIAALGRWGYYAAVSFMDWNVGRVLAALDSNGFGNNTVVLFTGRWCSSRIGGALHG